MNPISSDRQLVREDFTSKLPKALGDPYIMNTFEAPIICVAFYPCKKHQLADGRVIDGNEFRLMEYSKSFNSKKMLAGILGAQLEPPALVAVALRCEGTKGKDLKNYRTMLKEMWCEAGSRLSGNLKP